VTAIEWTDQTWNPTTGCSKVSPGCDHCYAETLSLRYGWSKKPWTIENEAENVVLHENRLRKPLTWKNPSRVFVNSMSDLFHEHIPDSFIAEVFAVMAEADRHTFQVLTKRPKRALAWTQRIADVMGSPFKVCPNVWIGVSIESWRFNWRADVLREIPAAVRFISAEPLLDTLLPGTSRDLDLTDIDWLIVGGESGHGYRLMEGEWVRELRDACLSEDYVGPGEVARVGPAFFFKQWGGRTPKSGGRLLDGREWNEMPA
jgi:protein gp37